jgi:dihydroorotate dehydrogenase electron transfer subunit
MIATMQGARVLQRSTPMAGGVELVCESPLAAEVRPGQFFQVAVQSPGALLRRPYSAAWTDPARGLVGFVFNVVGAGSEWLAARNSGDRIDLLGPLGRWFAIDGTRPAIGVAGGLGIAVFIGLCEALTSLGRPTSILYGARSADQLLPAARFPKTRMQVATDDGSAGHHGRVTALLSGAIAEDADIFACGPTPMLVELARWAQRAGIPLARIQVAHETPMGCGLGTCLGCALPRAGGGYLLTCQDGPCIPADQVAWTQVVDAFHG